MDIKMIKGFDPVLPSEPRERIHSCVATLLNPDVRLLTLTGVSGVGKTWLAREVVKSLVTRSVQPMWVELAELDNWLLFLPHLAETLGLLNGPHSLWKVKEKVFAYLRNEPRVLVLDAFDTVMPATAVLEELLQVCSNVQVLVTSRKSLSSYLEQRFNVSPLAIPDLKRPDTFSENSSVRLLRSQARHLFPNLALSDDVLALSAQLCARLDGLPIALLSAADRLEHHIPSELLSDLDTTGYLTTWTLDQTLESDPPNLYGLLKEQHDALPADAQRCLLCAAQFSYPFELAALQTLVMKYQPETPALHNLLGGLVAQGLLVQLPSEASAAQKAKPVFRLSYLMRDFLTIHYGTPPTELSEAYADYVKAITPAPKTAAPETLDYPEKPAGGEPPVQDMSDNASTHDLIEDDPEMLELFTEELTERELDVLQLVARGLSNREVARRLDISHRTVSTHLSNLYGKLGVRTRTAAALRARQLELVND